MFSCVMLRAAAPLLKSLQEIEENKQKEVSLENIPWLDQVYDEALPMKPW